MTRPDRPGGLRPAAICADCARTAWSRTSRSAAIDATRSSAAGWITSPGSPSSTRKMPTGRSACRRWTPDARLARLPGNIPTGAGSSRPVFGQVHYDGTIPARGDITFATRLPQARGDLLPRAVIGVVGRITTASHSVTCSRSTAGRRPCKHALPMDHAAARPAVPPCIPGHRLRCPGGSSAQRPMGIYAAARRGGPANDQKGRFAEP